MKIIKSNHKALLHLLQPKLQIYEHYILIKLIFKFFGIFDWRFDYDSDRFLQEIYAIILFQ